jgi:asparagine synthase (glutamine-hydrolysing)
MCGFAGIFHPGGRPIADAELDAMSAPIAHRGPDDARVHREPGLGFAFRRLAIVDVAGGAQPMSNEDGQVWSVFNGEIYNYGELMADLRGRGHHLRSACDAEVLVHAWEEWGKELPARLRGIFALAIWDRRTRTLFLARDRSGIKPLYVAQHRDEVRFASEAKALLASPGLARALDLAGYLGTAEIDPLLERTTFAGIHQVGPGCSLTIDRHGPRSRRYWTYDPAMEGDARPERIVDELREEIDRAVAMQLMADVPLGAYLSGGIDSAAVVATMQRHLGTPAHTLTTVFPGGASADPAFARLTSERLGTRRHFLNARADPATLALLPFAVWAAEGEVDFGYITRYQLAVAARRLGIKVILTGQGIDEITTGYYPDFAEFTAQAAQHAMASSTAPGYRGLPRFAAGSLAGVEVNPERLAVERLRLEHSRLSPGLLRFEDRMGMAAGVEVRVPLLDHRVVEIIAAVPPHLRPGLLSGKALLRRAVAAWMPAEVAERPKHAFNASALPLSRILLTGEGNEELKQLLSRQSIADRGYFEWSWCRSLLEQRNFVLLDHVLLVQLLDELFVSRFDPGRFAVPPAPPLEEIAATAIALPGAAQALPAAVARPRLSRSFARFRLEVSTTLDGRGLDQPGAVAEFVMPRPPVRLAPDALHILQLIDGRRSWNDIAEALGGRVRLPLLLEFAATLARHGIVDHPEAAT